MAGLVWVAGVSAQLTGWRDTDGWVYCHPQCDAWHKLGAVTVWTPPVVAVALLVVAAASWVQRLTAHR